jgi:hypothetical protein
MRSDSERDRDEVPAEIQTVIGATLTAFLGNKVRIRSVHLVDTPDETSAWATQGRVAVHESHNQRAKHD